MQGRRACSGGAARLAVAAVVAGCALRDAAASQVRYFASYSLRYNVTLPSGGVAEERLVAAELQRDVLRFLDGQAPPPLSSAFRLAVHSDLHASVLEDCPGCFAAAHLLVAEAMLYTAPARARELLADVAGIVGRWAPQPWESRAWGLERLASRAVAAQAATAAPAPASLDVVVAHCGEDLGWLLGAELTFPQGATRLWVYEKCASSSAPLEVVVALRRRFSAGVSILSLPNQGMESLAYARYLLEVSSRRLQPAEYGFFVQADPWKHVERGMLEAALQAIAAGTLGGVPFVHLNRARFTAVQSPCLLDIYQRLSPRLPIHEDMLFASYCCSQFLVHRERMAGLPEGLIDTVLSIVGDPSKPRLRDLICSQNDGHDSRPGIAMSALFENLWQVVFGEAPELPLRQDDASLPIFLRNAHDWLEGAGPFDYHVHYQAKMAP